MSPASPGIPHSTHCPCERGREKARARERKSERERDMHSSTVHRVHRGIFCMRYQLLEVKGRERDRKRERERERERERKRERKRER